MSTSILEIRDAIPRLDVLQFNEPINWQICNDEHWAVIGPNGGGKTVLIDILLGKYALKKGEVISDRPRNELVKSVAFRDIYGLVDTQNSYYQQRWNKGDEQEVPLVKELVSKVDQSLLLSLIEWFNISDLMEKEINLLSSGELRKFLIVKTLLTKPRVLILDNPYIGLDSKSRIVLNDLFVQLSQLEGLQIILILSNPDDIPNIITRVLPVSNMSLSKPITRNEFVQSSALQKDLFPAINTFDIPREPESEEELIYNSAAILKNIHIAYGQRTILKDLNWQIKRGEKWALLGPNGSGKSTLLSLICGDNPQAYANDITLFDRKRGSGESIWDIKKHIGYISPEMHLYYLKNVRCIDVVGSGFFDTIGLYRKCTQEQELIALEWMSVFRIAHLKDISFLNISSGEQRLVLLARLFVKNPDLLILDEPLHGLDIRNKQLVKQIIEEFCGADKSLIYVTHYEDEIPSVVDKRMVLTKIS